MLGKMSLVDYAFGYTC